MIVATTGIMASSISSGGGFDPNAQAFFNAVVTAGGSLSPTEETAINQFVLDLKSASIWSKFFAMYPMVGGSAASCSINLAAPASYALTFFGSPTIASTGVQWNGTTQYANTGLTLSSVLTSTNGGMSYYSRTNIDESAFDMGASTSGASTAPTGIIIRSGDTCYNLYGEGGYGINFNNYDSRGMYTVDRETATDTSAYKNGLRYIIMAEAATIPSQAGYLGALNAGGAPDYYSSRECAFASFNQSLTQTEVGDLYTAVQALQTTLGRQV